MNNVLNTRKCPFCGSLNLLEYLYGFPAYDYDKEKYILGGCKITDYQPIYMCSDCNKDIFLENVINIQIIDDTIKDLENNSNACKLVYIESSLSEQLLKLIKYFYDEDLVDEDYISNYEFIKNKKIEELTLQECLTYFTYIIRSDRFSSGYIYKVVSEGILLKLLERLRSILR